MFLILLVVFWSAIFLSVSELLAHGAATDFRAQAFNFQYTA